MRLWNVYNDAMIHCREGLRHVTEPESRVSGGLGQAWTPLIMPDIPTSNVHTIPQNTLRIPSHHIGKPSTAKAIRPLSLQPVSGEQTVSKL